MKNFYAVVGLFFLCNFNALAQIPSDALLLIHTTKLSGTNFSGTISNTWPDVQYEIQRRQNQTNWVSLGYVLGSETTNWTAFDFGITNAVDVKMIRVRSWIDSQGTGMPDWWQLRYFGNVGIDPYGNPEGDGWNNLQKFQNGMDPFWWYKPPSPLANISFRDGFANDIRHGSVTLTWKCDYGTIPDYFLIERANRTLRAMTNNPHFARPPSGARSGAFGTNRPPNFHPMPMYGRPSWQREDPLVTGAFEVVARIPSQPNIRDYRYVETNIDTLFQPIYRIQPHYSPPLHARLDHVNEEAIRKTILSVSAQRTTNGYNLTLVHPIPYARYLLLVRDAIDRQWRASGYFTSSTNRNPVYLHVDKKGMMSDAQSPIVMAQVKFLPDVVEPVFTAGWGEDSDGDSLPDIYEVLVTHTEPDNADTRNIGVLDGFKQMTDDGWSNLEKFQARADPQQPAQPPSPIEIKQPTAFEIMNAVTPKTDLHYETQILIRTNGSVNYQPFQQMPWIFYVNHGDPHAHRDFDLRMSWVIPKTPPQPAGGGP